MATNSNNYLGLIDSSNSKTHIVNTETEYQYILLCGGKLPRGSYSEYYNGFRASDNKEKTDYELRETDKMDLSGNFCQKCKRVILEQRYG